ncbi:MAG: undecaprenyl-phosphate glucose phosphotransferase [Bdellovibrio sp. CG_4_9_14_3_um_filter_39_7]|nr:MAG: undecaprenyl-phosphate glucose phosphotransferase [Bdellovibrio sp. CG_4_9_14_3_um_filter_39_7]
MLNQKKHIGITDNLSLISQALDSIGLSCLGLLIYCIYLQEFEIPKEYATIMIINTLLILTIFPYFGLYTSWRGKNKWQRNSSVGYAWLTVLFILVLITFAMKNSAAFSRIWFFSWGITGYFYLVIYRFIIDRILEKLRIKGINRKKILVFGAGVVGRKISKNLLENNEVGFDIFAFVDDDPKLIGEFIDQVPVKPAENLMDLIEECHELWIALPLRAEKRVLEILHLTRHKTSIIRYIPDIFNFRLLNHSITEIANIPIIEINGTPMSSISHVIKRIEDIVLSLIIITLITPIVLVVAILIKLTSKGPILYKQYRHGWNGKTIKIYKFRSMYFEKEDQFKQATQNDQRVTPIGKFIRRTSIDEFPQFFNVLQGRMSIVGPRPHAISMNEDFKDKVDNYMQRHKVKPGITGWAQVNGLRGETDTIEKMEKRIEYDLYYVQNWSLFLDFKIIYLTIFKGFTGKNAY